MPSRDPPRPRKQKPWNLSKPALISILGQDALHEARGIVGSWFAVRLKVQSPNLEVKIPMDPENSCITAETSSGQVAHDAALKAELKAWGIGDCLVVGVQQYALFAVGIMSGYLGSGLEGDFGFGGLLLELPSSSRSPPER